MTERMAVTMTIIAYGYPIVLGSVDCPKSALAQLRGSMCAGVKNLGVQMDDNLRN